MSAPDRQEVARSIAARIDWTPTVLAGADPRASIVEQVLRLAEYETRARTPHPADLTAARALHEPYPSTVPPTCQTCVTWADEEDVMGAPWPCSTASALGADPSSPFVAPWGAPLPRPTGAER